MMDEFPEEIQDVEGQLEHEQNTETIPIRFLWLDGEFTLSIVILVTALAMAVITAAGGVFYRRRRLKRRAEKEELRRHREQS
jgi:uncharacterized membrane protein YciS (DUF1049 family)